MAWAGTTAPAMWQALDQQGVLASTTVVTGLDIRASWPTFGAAGTKISFLSHYFDGATDTEAANGALKQAVPGGDVDLFHPDGFTAAQMIVRALEAGGDDVDEDDHRAGGLELRRGQGQARPSAPRTTPCCSRCSRPSSTGSGTDLKAELVKALTPEEATPPAVAMK